VLPPFDLQGGFGVALARSAAMTGLLSCFGTAAFRTLVAPRAFARMQPDGADAVKRKLLILAQLSVAVATLGLCVWLVLEAAYIADADSVSAMFAAVPPVIGKTSFGHVVILQLVTLAVLAVTIGWRDTQLRQRLALAITAAALSLQSGHSHAFSMQPGPSLLLACDVVHLLGAGGWLGGLIPLLMLVMMAPYKAAATGARWFSPLGQLCIVALTISAAIQGWVLVASVPGLIGTAYGWMVFLKLVLFGVLVGFAWFNRYRFAPALLREAPEGGKHVLVRSIATQTGFALAIVVAASVLSELPPAMHLQALWPFSERPSLAAVQEDPDFLYEVLWAGGAIAASLAVLALSLVLRRLRLVALAVFAVVGWFALPHMDVLLVPAYPTSFYHSPSAFASSSIVEGAALFGQNCVSCHGAGGRGDGALAKTLPVPPADLTAAHLWMHSDGELFWWVGHGMVTPENTQAMPGFADTLDEDQLWALIDYIRAHNAGYARHETASWPHPIQAPDFGLHCGERVMQLADMRGRFVRLVIGAAPPASAETDAVTVVAGVAPKGVCVAQDETVPAAYAIVAGVAPAALAGAQFLIDGSGWLRAVQLPTGPGDWDKPGALRAEITRLQAHAVTSAATQSMKMNMPM
jgi:putative copper export protein/mono/diheme cytochrome c family protein